ncbi:MAG: hypothetical protein SFT90_02245 [Rickettsiales bacterium]|nr:hypothetical protein [Rickettsiales bacterium]
MAYYKSLFERLVEEMFSGPNRKINIVTLISVINAGLIFGLLWHLELENEGLLTIFGFFIVWRTLILSAISFLFRTNVKRDFAKFLCVMNLLVAISADYLIYNGDITDSGWEVIGNIEAKIFERQASSNIQAPSIQQPQNLNNQNIKQNVKRDSLQNYNNKLLKEAQEKLKSQSQKNVEQKILHNSTLQNLRTGHSIGE